MEDAQSHGNHIAAPRSPIHVLIQTISSAILSCGKHKCPQRCHQLFDHSKIKCIRVLEDTCPQNHKITWECWQEAPSCRKCAAEARKREAQRQRDHQLDLQRQANERAYAQKLAELDEQIAQERCLQKEQADQLGRNRTLEQRRKDLADARAVTRRNVAAHPAEAEAAKGLNAETPNGGHVAKAFSSSQSNPSEGSGESGGTDPSASQAKADWEYQKKFENSDNEHLDALFEMIGLESVKQQLLTTKSKIDTGIRQKVELKDERFGAALLGNPGTGMYKSVGSLWLSG
jgi:hypothetical protein